MNINFPLLLSSPTAINVLSWVAFGLLIGAIVSMVVPGKAKGGTFGTLFVGVVGALVGGVVANFIYNVDLAQFNWQGLALAIGGAFLVAALQRLLFRTTDKIKTTTSDLS